MTTKPIMTKQQAIDELRNEAQALEDKPASITEYASNAYKAKIRRNLADKLESGLAQATANSSTKTPE